MHIAGNVEVHGLCSACGPGLLDGGDRRGGLLCVWHDVAAIPVQPLCRRPMPNRVERGDTPGRSTPASPSSMPTPSTARNTAAPATGTTTNTPHLRGGRGAEIPPVVGASRLLRSQKPGQLGPGNRSRGRRSASFCFPSRSTSPSSRSGRSRHGSGRSGSCRRRAACVSGARRQYPGPARLAVGNRGGLLCPGRRGLCRHLGRRDERSRPEPQGDGRTGPAVLAVAAAVFCWTALRNASGKFDLLIDEQSKALTLPQTAGRTQAMTFPRGEIAGVCVQRRVSRLSSGSFYSYLPALDRREAGAGLRREALSPCGGPRRKRAPSANGWLGNWAWNSKAWKRKIPSRKPSRPANGLGFIQFGATFHLLGLSFLILILILILILTEAEEIKIKIRSRD